MNRFFLPLLAVFHLGWTCQCSDKPSSPDVVTTDSASGPAPIEIVEPAASVGAPQQTAEAVATPPAAPAEYAPRARTNSQLDEGVFTFMSYNLKNYLTMERGSSEKPKPENEIKAVIAMITDVKPDILGVCEIGTKEDLLDLQKRLKEAGLDLPNADLCDGPDAYRSLGLLSRYPIVSTNHQTNLSYQMAGQTFPYNRGIHDAIVEPAPGYRLHLLGTHLKSKRPVDEGDEAEMRRNESRLLRKHIEGIMAAEPDTNLLVYGDMNDTKNTDVILDLKGKEGRPDHLYDLWLRDRFGFTWTHYWITADEYARIDYILYTKSLAPEILKQDSYVHHAPEWFTASDHRPLVVRISPKDVKPK
ncbi:MAG: endonuclease/exonuclease/phosphatase family protein [Verrucomicrobiales bacterium]